jgi:hypothetical protein
MSVGSTGRKILDDAVAGTIAAAVETADALKLVLANEEALRAQALDFIKRAFEMPRDFLQEADLAWADIGTDHLGEIYSPLQRWASMRRLKNYGADHYKMGTVVPTEEDQAEFELAFGAPQSAPTPSSHRRKLQIAGADQFIMPKCPYTFLHALPFTLFDPHTCTQCANRGGRDQCMRCCLDHFTQIRKKVIDGLAKCAQITLERHDLEGSLSPGNLAPDVAEKVWSGILPIIEAARSCSVCRPKGGLMAKLVAPAQSRQDKQKEQAKKEDALARKVAAAAGSKQYKSSALIEDSDEELEREPPVLYACAMCYIMNRTCDLDGADNRICCTNCIPSCHMRQRNGRLETRTSCYVPCPDHQDFVRALRKRFGEDLLMAQTAWKADARSERGNITKQVEAEIASELREWARGKARDLYNECMRDFVNEYQRDGCTACSKQDLRPGQDEDELDDLLDAESDVGRDDDAGKEEDIGVPQSPQRKTANAGHPELGSGAANKDSDSEEEEEAIGDPQSSRMRRGVEGPTHAPNIMAPFLGSASVDTFNSNLMKTNGSEMPFSGDDSFGFKSITRQPRAQSPDKKTEVGLADHHSDVGSVDRLTSVATEDLDDWDALGRGQAVGSTDAAVGETRSLIIKLPLRASAPIATTGGALVGGGDAGAKGKKRKSAPGADSEDGLRRSRRVKERIG